MGPSGLSPSWGGNRGTVGHLCAPGTTAGGCSRCPVIPGVPNPRELSVRPFPHSGCPQSLPSSPGAPLGTGGALGCPWSLSCPGDRSQVSPVVWGARDRGAGSPLAELSPLGTGKLSFQQPQVLHRLALELQPHLCSLSPAQVSRCARSFASLRWLSRPLAEAMAQVRPGGQGAPHLAMGTGRDLTWPWARGGPHLAMGGQGTVTCAGGVVTFLSRFLSPVWAVVTWEQVALRAPRCPSSVPSENWVISCWIWVHPDPPAASAGAGPVPVVSQSCPSPSLCISPSTLRYSRAAPVTGQGPRGPSPVVSHPAQSLLVFPAFPLLLLSQFLPVLSQSLPRSSPCSSPPSLECSRASPRAWIQSQGSLTLVFPPGRSLWLKCPSSPSQPCSGQPPIPVFPAVLPG